MRMLGVFLVLLLLMAWVRNVPVGSVPAATVTLETGLLLLAGYAAGHLLTRVRLPRITGYLIVGIIIGPHVMGLLPQESIEGLGFLNGLAVTFIALAAGGELRLQELRHRMKIILLVIASLTVTVFIVVTLFVDLQRGLVPFLAPFSELQVLAVAGLFGVLAVARSPSSAIAVIQETRAHGPFTETALGVTVVMDVLVIILFAIAVSFCEVTMSPAAAVDLIYIGMLILEIGSGIVAGYLIGRAIAFYTDRVNANLPLLLIGTALLVTHISHALADYLQDVHDLSLKLEPLLICVTAGFTVQNFSQRGPQFIQAVNAIGLPVYVLFFSLAGAGLDLTALQQAWLVALSLVVVRLLGIFLGAYIGGTLGGDPAGHNRIAGMAYVTQAGVSLGLAMEVLRRFPEWGGTFVTIVVAVIAINQMLGPIAMKQVLVLVGEARDT
jgi:Kef-type K+ transport system membrane component KefB